MTGGREGGTGERKRKMDEKKKKGKDEEKKKGEREWRGRREGGFRNLGSSSECLHTC